MQMLKWEKWNGTSKNPPELILSHEFWEILENLKIFKCCPPSVISYIHGPSNIQDVEILRILKARSEFSGGLLIELQQWNTKFFLEIHPKKEVLKENDGCFTFNDMIEAMEVWT